MKSKGDNESFLFQNKLDASIFLFLIGLTFCFMITLLLGFLIQISGFEVSSHDLQILLFLELLLLLTVFGYALFLGRLVAWANVLLKMRWGSQDAVPTLIYLIARSIGAISRALIKFIAGLISR